MYVKLISDIITSICGSDVLFISLFVNKVRYLRISRGVLNLPKYEIY